MKYNWIKTVPIFLFVFFCSFLIQGCNGEDEEGTQLHVVTTLSIYGNILEEVGGELIHIDTLLPVGVEPEEYEPLPSDMRAIHSADLFFFTGYNMERWLPRIIPDIHEWSHAIPLAEHPDIETIPITDGPFAGEPDPHVWTNVQNTILIVGSIVETLKEFDKENGKAYEAQGNAYIQTLKTLHERIKSELSLLPKEKRYLITSELCFQYFARAYGFEHDAIWPINAAEEGTPSQIIRIVNRVREWNVPAVFIENQIDPRPMEQVSRETGVPLGGILYSDSLGLQEDDAHTYVGMMTVNIERIIHALLEEEVSMHGRSR